MLVPASVNYNHNDVDAAASRLRFQGLDGALTLFPEEGAAHLGVWAALARGQEQHGATVWRHALADPSHISKCALDLGGGWV